VDRGRPLVSADVSRTKTMPFPAKQVSELLAKCHRRCCICHRFSGVKMETDHIVPKDAGGDDKIENAIPVCFECHAEIHSYNDRHPRGRKFQSKELRLHRDKWLQICLEQPEVLVSAGRYSDVGPLQALIDELELNARIAARSGPEDQGATFHEAQLRRAIHEEAVAILKEGIRDSVLDAYIAMAAANQSIATAWSYPKGSGSWANGVNAAQRRINDAKVKIAAAKGELLKFLGSESDAG
jgi:hypothetical protein